DFGEGNALAGVELQRKYERLAFQKALGYKGAVQRFEDAKNGAKVNVLGNVIPSIKSGYTLCNIKECLPNYVFDGVLEGILEFGKKIKGFDHPDGILTAIESRSSSPVRILRDENFNSSIKGLYPCGEGAGYAGGITSAAVDGIKTALSVK
ncbi:MAG: FAD-dependent oxidoreductase, partial [Clostridia bacterium]|nr:FAD-dependent oxidoreductase [Clostridia bacterium]